ncbi:hypothetical protein [Longitalea luteola]|uniref:hypothetical protein n=1 Tax=Longitalea luteola TaxID=2812563 RepID=UPI001A96B947|nr:hypothetical protein [Longitalea luteola]
MSEIIVKQIIIEKDGVEYNARPATEAELNNAGLTSGCNCGEEMCLKGWLWRCTASGGGACDWYITDIVCKLINETGRKPVYSAGHFG